jgi:ADP-ribose pyrophosphatase YjhB (NUDIX family)
MHNRWKPNVTVAAVIERDGRFLLVEEHTSDGLRLNNPAGHLDPGEGLADACARETLEETAHRFRPTALVGVYLSRTQRPPGGLSKPGSVTYLRVAFCGELGDFLPDQRLDHGIVRTLWMTAEEIRASVSRHRSPVLLQCVEDYLAGTRFPMALLHTDLQ